MKSVIKPKLLKNIAEWGDYEDGKLVKRDAKGFVEQLETGIPGLRQTLPEKTKRSSSGGAGAMLGQFKGIIGNHSSIAVNSGK